MNNMNKSLKELLTDKPYTNEKSLNKYLKPINKTGDDIFGN